MLFLPCGARIPGNRFCIAENARCCRPQGRRTVAVGNPCDTRVTCGPRPPGGRLVTVSYIFICIGQGIPATNGLSLFLGAVAYRTIRFPSHFGIIGAGRCINVTEAAQPAESEVAEVPGRLAMSLPLAQDKRTLRLPSVGDPPPGVPVARVVVDVMLKPEILDPQGQAVQRALPRLGYTGISDVRQGKRFELEVAEPVDDAAIARIRQLADSFLANTVIEDFTVRVES